MPKCRQKTIGFLVAVVLLSTVPTSSIAASAALSANNGVAFSNFTPVNPVAVANCFPTITPPPHVVDTQTQTLHFDGESPSTPLYQENSVVDFNANDFALIDPLWTDDWYFTAGTEVQFQAFLPEHLQECAVSGTLVNSRNGQSTNVYCPVINGSILSTVQIIESGTYRLILEDETGKKSFEGVPITYTAQVSCKEVSISSPYSSVILCSNDTAGQETSVNENESTMPESINEQKSANHPK